MENGSSSRLLRTCLAVIGLAILCGCAGRTVLLRHNPAFETELLRSHCERQSIQSIYRSKGDSVFTLAHKASRKEPDMAAGLMERAGFYYRMALSADQVPRLERQISELQKRVSHTRELLSTYRAVETEMKAGVR